MALDSYFFNISKRLWVRSFAQPAAIDGNFPVFGNTDARDFDVTFLRNTSVERVEVVQSVVSAQIAISAPSTPATVMTSATAGTASNNAYPFVLNISGSGISSFMSGATEKKVALCEFRIATASGTNRYQTSIYIAPNQTTDTTADPAATDRALGANEAAGIYMAKDVPVGTRWLWTDETTGQRYSVGFANGQFQANLL